MKINVFSLTANTEKNSFTNRRGYAICWDQMRMKEKVSIDWIRQYHRFA